MASNVRVVGVEPIFSVTDVPRAVAHYEQLGFSTSHHDEGYAFAHRDAALSYGRWAWRTISRQRAPSRCSGRASRPTPATRSQISAGAQAHEREEREQCEDDGRRGADPPEPARKRPVAQGGDSDAGGHQPQRDPAVVSDLAESVECSDGGDRVVVVERDSEFEQHGNAQHQDAGRDRTADEDQIGCQ